MRPDLRPCRTIHDTDRDTDDIPRESRAMLGLSMSFSTEDLGGQLAEGLGQMAESGVTMRSDSEQYSPGSEEELSPSTTSSNSPIILYKPPTAWSLIRGIAINLVLPFINGMMLGFGELFAHEAAFRLGWGGTKVFPVSRRRTHPIGPGLETRERRDQLAT